MPRLRKRHWLARGFRAERASAGDRPPRYGPRSSHHRRRGPVPRQASVEETAAAGARFSRRSSTRGGNPLACACGMRGPPRYGPRSSRHRRARACPSPCLGRGNGRGWRAVFAQMNDRGGQAPALRAKKPDPDPFGIRRARTTTIASRPGGLAYSAHTRLYRIALP